jgi:hypothetical protein
MTPPPRPRNFDALVRAKIAERPGPTLAELVRSTGLFRGEVVAALSTLGGAVEIRNDGRFYLRDRRKPKRRASLWDRFIDWMLANAT